MAPLDLLRGSAITFEGKADWQQKGSGRCNASSGAQSRFACRRPYCSGCPPGPGKAVIGVPSVKFPAITLFLKDCNVPPKLATPVTFCVTVEPAIRRVADAPATAAPVLILKLINVLSTTALKAPPVLATAIPTLVLPLRTLSFTRTLEGPPPP